jgi:DNA adenine methylase
MKNPNTKPALKWVGGKQRLLQSLLPHIPAGGRLIEPFVGAGSVFLAAGDRDILINDMNTDLMAMYTMLKERPEQYIEQARKMFSKNYLSQHAYLEARAQFNASSDKGQRAILFLYLNKFGFNGLYRVNKQGHHNVPYAHPKTLPGFPEAALQSIATRMSRAEIMAGDFRAAMDLAGAGDVVYCDPPYADAADDHPTFVNYTKGGFAAQDHLDLASRAKDASARGATVILSNHDTPFVRELYEGMALYAVEVRRSVAADSAKRGRAQELIAVLAPTTN